MRALRMSIIVALAFLAACAGTGSPFDEEVPPVAVRSTGPDASRLGEVSRVMILPLGAESGFEDQVAVVTDRLARELQRGRFTVVPSPSSREAAALMRGDLSLISTRTASTIWRVAQVFDASRDAVASDAVAWYAAEVAGADAPFGPEVVLLSPKAFAHYVCRRVAETLETPTASVASLR